MTRLFIGIAVFSALLMATTSNLAEYEQSIHEWQQHRDAGLRSPDGWLTLVGLFWLKPGDTTVGSAASNDIVLPKSAPAEMGRLHLANGTVTFTGVDGNSRPLSYDEDHPDVLHAGTISLYVIKRDDRFAVRAKDSASATLKNFRGVTYFPIDPSLRFHAKFIPDKKMIPILNFVGMTGDEESPGIVEFTYRGSKYHLRPIYEGETLFFLFKDPTNRTDTYQAGRMLNTPLPVDGTVDLDFNHSYNPPCTFTPFATCPLPPKENTLPFAVTAGEKRYRRGHPD